MTPQPGELWRPKNGVTIYKVESVSPTHVVVRDRYEVEYLVTLFDFERGYERVPDLNRATSATPDPPQGGA